jgi:YD repeat-containing protein
MKLAGPLPNRSLDMDFTATECDSLTVANAAVEAVAFLTSVPRYPGAFSGRGIVTCAGGVRYLTCAWVQINMLRRLGCTLPIEVWYLGEEERDPHWVELVEPLGVRCVDAREVSRNLPTPHPRLRGWESKAFAVGGLPRLTSVTDSYGRTVTYSHYGSELNYCLQQITDFLGRQLTFQYDNLGHLVAIVTPSINNAATGNTFPGCTAYVFQYDVNNPRPERQDDLVQIWFPNQATPFIDTATRTADVAAVYASAAPRYVVAYGQDPTDTDTWGRVVQETIGDPANGVGGTYSYQNTDQDLPVNLVDPPVGDSPGDPITFQCTVTDRNGNQRVYGFNAAQMPSMVTVMRTRSKINIPSLTDSPSFTTWTKFNVNNQPLLVVFPQGNSVAFTYDTNSTGVSNYNRRAGLLLERTESATNPFAGTTIPAYYEPSNGQSQLTELFFYDPIFNQLCASVERRGNPIDSSGHYFAPQNLGTASALRYATFTYYDYQKNAEDTIETAAAAVLGISPLADI